MIGDEKTLFPDNAGLLEATRVLVKEGFVVLPYTNDDVVNARKLIDAGAAAVMPLAAPIGSGMGVQNPANLRIMREMITEVPMIVDAGVGTASDAAVAMELGADGVLMNTAIAAADDAGKDGARHEAGRGSRPSGLRSRPHAEEALRQRQQPGRRCGRQIGGQALPPANPLARIPRFEGLVSGRDFSRAASATPRAALAAVHPAPTKGSVYAAAAKAEKTHSIRRG